MTRKPLILAAVATALVLGTAFAYGPRFQSCADVDGAPSANQAQTRQQLHEPGTADPALMTRTRQRLHEPVDGTPAEATQTQTQTRQRLHEPGSAEAAAMTQARLQKRIHVEDAVGTQAGQRFAGQQARQVNQAQQAVQARDGSAPGAQYGPRR